MSDEARHAGEKREGVRLDHPVMVAYRTVDRFLCDFGTNISQTGIFVNTPEPLPVGTTVRLLISLPEVDVPEIRGRVARVQDGSDGSDAGMGVEFLDLDPAVERRLEEIVRELRERLGQS